VKIFKNNLKVHKLLLFVLMSVYLKLREQGRIGFSNGSCYVLKNNCPINSLICFTDFYRYKANNSQMLGIATNPIAPLFTSNMNYRTDLHQKMNWHVEKIITYHIIVDVVLPFRSAKTFFLFDKRTTANIVLLAESDYVVVVFSNSSMLYGWCPF
jgi:hypothetical protein